MQIQEYFYRCSKEYISSISPMIYDEVIAVINALPKRQMQAELNKDFFWLFLNRGWTYDSKPQNLPNVPPEELGITDAKLRLRKKIRSFVYPQPHLMPSGVLTLQSNLEIILYRLKCSSEQWNLCSKTSVVSGLLRMNVD